MKKILLVLLVVMMGSYGCTKEVCKCNFEETQWKIVDYTITINMWTLVGEPDEIGSYYYYLDENVPELSQRVYDDGIIMCYYIYVDEFGDEVQTPLPFSAYDIVVDEDWEFPWSVHFSYDVTPGSIAFKIVFSDFYTGDWQPPARCKFRLVMIY